MSSRASKVHSGFSYTSLCLTQETRKVPISQSVIAHNNSEVCLAIPAIVSPI